MPENSSTLVKTTLLVTVVAASSKILGFLRETVIAYVFGVGAVTDAYTIALRVVTTAGLLTGTYLTVTFIPHYVRVRERQGDAAALKITNDTLGLSLLISIALMVLLQIAAPVVLLAFNFDPAQSSIALIAIRIKLIQLPITVLITLFMVYLTARQRFLGPNLLGIPLSLVIIVLCLIWGTASGVVGLTAASVLGAVSQLLVLFFLVGKEKFRYKPSFRFNTPDIRENMALLVPALFSAVLLDIILWVDTIIATNLGEGTVAAIAFSQRLLMLVQGLIIIPVAGMIFSFMSKFAAQNDIPKMLDTLWKTIRMVFFVVVPLVMVAIPSSNNIIQIVFQRGEFTAEDTFLTATAFLWYLPGLLGTAANIFLLRFYYVMRDTKTPMLCGLISAAVNIALSITLSNVMELAGIALATSISITLSALLLLIMLRIKLGPMGLGKTAKDIIKISICGIPCILVAICIGHLLIAKGPVISFALSASAGIAVYIVLALLLKEMAVLDIIEMAKAWLSKKRDC